LFEQRLTGRYSRALDRTDLLNLVRGGEDTHIEFKIRLVNTDKIVAEIVALANGGGGAILFGVNDQRRLEGLDDPEQVEDQLIDICRNQIKPPVFPRIDKVAFDNGVRIVVLQVEDRRAPHSTLDNRYYIRVGSTKREADGDELAVLFSRSRSAAFEDMPLPAASVEEMDEALVWSYIRDIEGDSFTEPDGFPTAIAVKDLLLGTNSEVRVTPTLAGFLLFGQSEAVERLIPQSRLTLVRFSGTDPRAPVVEKVDCYGNLGFCFDRAYSFIRRYVDVWERRPPRASQSNLDVRDPVPPRVRYSRDVVVEALTNLLVHRDYSIVSPVSQVSIFDNRMIFANPTRLNGTSTRSIEYGATRRRNPRVHHHFTSPEYGVESARRGVPALRRAHYEFARRAANITATGDEFRLEVFGV
jgi:ATP-dependent DNA helicase RecG